MVAKTALAGIMRVLFWFCCRVSRAARYNRIIGSDGIEVGVTNGLRKGSYMVVSAYKL